MLVRKVAINEEQVRAFCMEKGLKANSVKARTYSLCRQGCMYYQAIPMMKEERLRPLVERFAELLHRHSVF
ncbi:hypothetical protein [Corallococcus macrosporus]|uniref:Uncharacterized protein n=1 Tax=Myxococcus fulvus (strain ATCC BAA-855 / HW-1) TaxID=483219 RepID=F8C7Z9_MYXFH|nr:hypothetical protein [Corallococcus macrosporus]AEI66951.1 hypothetical protein LILAB_25290 [Corallococcus macrosporus]